MDAELRIPRWFIRINTAIGGAIMILMVAAVRIAWTLSVDVQLLQVDTARTAEDISEINTRHIVQVEKFDAVEHRLTRIEVVLEEREKD